MLSIVKIYIFIDIFIFDFDLCNVFNKISPGCLSLNMVNNSDANAQFLDISFQISSNNINLDLYGKRKNF